MEDMLTSRDKQNIRNNQRNKRNAGERGEAVSYVSKEDNRTSDVTTTEPDTKQSLSTAVTTSLTDKHTYNNEINQKKLNKQDKTRHTSPLSLFSAIFYRLTAYALSGLCCGTLPATVGSALPPPLAMTAAA